MKKNEVKTPGILKAVLEQTERVTNEPTTYLNPYGRQYDVNVNLRNQFPNSYFLHEGYDEAIVAVDCITESIIYDSMHVGVLYIDHEENNHADLGDMIYGGAKLINWMNALTSEELSGKVKPSLILQNHHMKFWDKRLDGE